MHEQDPPAHIKDMDQTQAATSSSDSTAQAPAVSAYDSAIRNPRHGDVAYYEDCVPGGVPYRVVLVWRHRDPAQGWFSVAGIFTRPIDVSGKVLHLLLNSDGFATTGRVHERPVSAHM